MIITICSIIGAIVVYCIGEGIGYQRGYEKSREMDIASVEATVAKISEITDGLTVDEARQIGAAIVNHVEYVARPLREEIGDLREIIDMERNA